MTYKISREKNPHPDDLQMLGNGIMDYAQKTKSQAPMEFFAFFIRDEHNKIHGGCNGVNLYGALHIDQLWVSESLRGLGFGTQLMHAAERWGREHHCTLSTVNTMDWEALEFYKKFGYEIEFERRGFLKDSVFYFLRKNLR